MALTLSLSTTPMGVEFPESYARINSGFSFKDTTTITVFFYATSHARALEASPVMTKDFRVKTSALTGNLWPAMYSYLKTLPEFTGAQNA